MKYSLFEVFGIEAEYMIVDAKTLELRPFAEDLLKSFSSDGNLHDEIERGEIAWSNELVCHVIEIKSNGPKSDLVQLEAGFVESIQEINNYLSSLGCCLLPTSMHPFHKADSPVKLWPHGQKDVYNTYHQIFNCRGHGWSNLQSVHLNLPFSNEDEFARLHAAMRIVLPLVPFLCASSPFVEGVLSKNPDSRLKFYENNQSKIPSITGKVIPERIFSYKDYQGLYEKMYQSVSPYDPNGHLQHPWLNSRGVIAKFDVGALELRLIDIQESPRADFSLLDIFIGLIKELVEEKHVSFEDQTQTSTSWLKQVYDEANFYDVQLSLDYLKLLNLESTHGICAALLKKSYLKESTKDYLQTITGRGHLASRIKKDVESGKSVFEIYQILAQKLAHNQIF